MFFQKDDFIQIFALINSFEGMGIYGRLTLFISFLLLNHTQSIPVGFNFLLATMKEETKIYNP